MKTNSSPAILAMEGMYALQFLLILIIKSPRQFVNDQQLKMAIRSQNGFAKLDREFTIEGGAIQKTHPTSLNTLKKNANDKLPGGFKGLDVLRRKSLEALELDEKRENRGNKRSKSGLSFKVSILEQELEMHRHANLLLLHALQEALGQFNSIRDATDAALRTKRAADARETLVAITSLVIPPFNLPIRIPLESAPNIYVTNIDEYRR